MKVEFTIGGFESFQSCKYELYKYKQKAIITV